MEFYLENWDIIGDDFVNLVKFVMSNKIISCSQRKGIITLISKGGDKKELKNWRPISLLCVDYKIIAKLLANRMKEVLSEIIKSDQVGYMKDRNIGEAIRLIDDMMFHCLTNDINSFLIAVDFEKSV